MNSQEFSSGQRTTDGKSNLLKNDRLKKTAAAAAEATDKNTFCKSQQTKTLPPKKSEECLLCNNFCVL